MIAWNVYLHGRLINTVFYLPSANQADVREGLIDHDGYNPSIKVYRRSK